MKDKLLDVLKILSESIILFLAPAAILTAVNYFLHIEFIDVATKVLNMLVCGYFGYRLSEYFHGTKISGAATFVVALLASRSVFLTEGVITVKLGDLLTAIFISLFTVWFIKIVGQAFGNYSVLLVLPTTLIICLPIGDVMYAISTKVMNGVVHGLTYLFTLQPFLMGGLLAISFGVIILSPFSSVAVATILGITGIPAATATIGIICVALGFSIQAIRANGFVKACAIFIGSPKMMMPNFVSKPKIILPHFFSMFISGAVFAVLGVKSTTLAAGFGSIGFLGWVDLFRLQPSWNIVEKVALFILFPLILSLIACFIAKITKNYDAVDFEMKVDL